MAVQRTIVVLLALATTAYTDSTTEVPPATPIKPPLSTPIKPPLSTPGTPSNTTLDSRNATTRIKFYNCDETESAELVEKWDELKLCVSELITSNPEEGKCQHVNDTKNYTKSFIEVSSCVYNVSKKNNIKRLTYSMKIFEQMVNFTVQHKASLDDNKHCITQLKPKIINECIKPVFQGQKQLVKQITAGHEIIMHELLRADFNNTAGIGKAKKIQKCIKGLKTSDTSCDAKIAIFMDGLFNTTHSGSGTAMSSMFMMVVTLLVLIKN